MVIKIRGNWLARRPQLVPPNFHVHLRYISQTNMSRRAAIVEEFDDDTDLPLPSLPLPNTGSRGPLIQELHISDDELEPSPQAGPVSPPLRQSHFSESTSKPSENQRNVTDITPYKTSVVSLSLFFSPPPVRLLSWGNCYWTWSKDEIAYLGGRVFIQFIWMQNVHMGLVKDGLSEGKAYGGPLAKILRMLRTS